MYDVCILSTSKCSVAENSILYECFLACLLARVLICVTDTISFTLLLHGIRSLLHGVDEWDMGCIFRLITHPMFYWLLQDLCQFLKVTLTKNIRLVNTVKLTIQCPDTYTSNQYFWHVNLFYDVWSLSIWFIQMLYILSVLHSCFILDDQ